MKARINKVIALGICMIMLFSAGVFAEEGAELAVAPENKVSEMPIVQVEDNVSSEQVQGHENKDAEHTNGVFSEEGSGLQVAPENKVSEMPIVQVEENVSENKDAEPAKEVISEINPEKAKEKLTVDDTKELPEKEILIEEVQ